MGILWMIVIGLIAGGLAKLVIPGRQGVLFILLLGVGGSLLAGLMGQALGWYDEPGEGPGLVAAAIGALLVLGIYTAGARRKPKVVRDVEA